MEYNKTRASNDAAQTASVGNNQMMTFMKMPLDVSANVNVTMGNGSPSGRSESDVHFLEGLFDPMSGSSENGSEKQFGGSDDGDNMNMNMSVNDNDNMNVSANTNRSLNLAITNNGTMPSSNMSMRHATLPMKAPLQLQDPGQAQVQVQVQAQRHSTSAMHPNMTSTNATTMHSVNGPQHAAALQQHAQCGGGGGGGTEQVNNAARAMSDVSSLTSSSNGNSSPRNVHYQQTNETRTYAGMTTANLMSNQQAQQQAQVQAQAQAQAQGVAAGGISSNLQNTGQAFQTWIIPTSGTSNGIPQALPYQQNVPQNAGIVQPLVTIPCPETTSQGQAQTKPTKGKRKRRTPSVPPSSKEPIHASVSEDEGDPQKRRHNRNKREQERSQRIASQISLLKELLATSHVPFKPDKFSTLVSVHGFIKSLVENNAQIDEEQQKLVETITKTNELVTKAQLGHNAFTNSSSVRPSTNEDGTLQVVPSSGTVPISEEEEELLQFVRGVDYKSVFSRVNIPLCVTRIDGRLIDCNDEFARICGLSMEELCKAGLREHVPADMKPELAELYGSHPLSLFNLIAKEDMQTIFEAMSRMLNTTYPKEEEERENAVKLEVVSSADIKKKKKNRFTHLDFWSGQIQRCHVSGSQVCIIILIVVTIFYYISKWIVTNYFIFFIFFCNRI